MNSPLMSTLEKEWAHHKYAVLEKDPAAYQAIRTLLKNKQDPDPVLFYDLIEKAYAQEDQIGRQDNAIQHVWGYFKQCATVEEKAAFEDKHSRWIHSEMTLRELKKELFDLALKYQRDYLLNSSYFDSVR
jgi:UV DNA damage endonuclease